MRAPAFKPGDTVIVCGELPTFNAEIKWVCSGRCEEHGDYVYQCFVEMDGDELEGPICENALASAAVQ